MTATEDYLDSLDPAVDWVKWPILARPDEDVASVDHIYALPSTSITPHWHLVTEGLEKRELGMELTLRVARQPEDEEPPEWSFRLLVTMCRFMREDGPVSPGDTQELSFPVTTSLLEQIARELLPRVRFGGGGFVATPTSAVLVFEHADASRWDFDPEAGLCLWLTAEDAQALENDLVRGPGAYALPSLVGFEIGVSEDAQFATIRARKKAQAISPTVTTPDAPRRR